MELENREITEAIIGAAFEVYHTLGYGFLEKVYQRACKSSCKQEASRR